MNSLVSHFSVLRCNHQARFCLFVLMLLLSQSVAVLANDGFNLNSLDNRSASISYVVFDDGGLIETRTSSMHDTAAMAQIYFNKPGINEIETYNLLTPNGDGSNDVWMISGIEEYPENSVQIFSRWGNKIRDFRGYNNNSVVWDGTNLKNETLPAGTYFYLLEIKNLGVKKGCIYLTNSNK